MQIAEMDVGDRLTIEGRVQSRTYTKMLETGSEERTAFEVSVMQLVEEAEDAEAEFLSDDAFESWYATTLKNLQEFQD